MGMGGVGAAAPLQLRRWEWLGHWVRSSESRDIFFLSPSSPFPHPQLSLQCLAGDKTAAPRANSFVDPQDTEDWAEERTKKT